MKRLNLDPSKSFTIVTAIHQAWPFAILSFLLWVSIIVCIDPAGSYPMMPEGPGLTVDELFNVEQGVYLVEHAKRLGWLNFVPGTSQDVYSKKGGYNPDHPPLGRWWLGIHHELTWWITPPFEPDAQIPIVTACARTGSATAFGLTVFLLGWLTTVWSGRAVGLMTAISLALMPRVYGHAHLASLETITNLTCTASVLVVAAWWNGPRPPTRRAAIMAGVFWGLALLTKIQAVLIPIPVVCWVFWRWKSKAVLPIVVWGATAIVVFFAGWPYLWSDPVVHFAEYFGRSTNRATLQVWYFGQKYADKSVPWHYPFVMFAITVPAILHLFGFLGLLSSGNRFASWRSAATADQELKHNPLSDEQTDSSINDRDRDYLLAACMVFPLVVFALPGVAVYDGERLFLTCFPLWAIFVGRGWIVFWQSLLRWTNSRATANTLCSILLAVEVLPLVTLSPCHLCYYNSVFYLRPSLIDTVGFEVDYWGVGVTRRLLQKTVDSVPEHSNVGIVPTLHPFQADDYRRQSPILRKHGIKTVENRAGPNSPDYALVYHRRADLPPFVKEHHPTPLEKSDATRFGGLWLAYLARLKP